MSPRRAWSLVRSTDGREVAGAVRLADSFARRLRGLLGVRKLPPGHGLLIVPCSGVHTLFMRFPIDAVALDHKGTVVDVRRRIPPWRPLVLPGGKPFAILELRSGAAGVRPGDQLRLREAFLPDRPPIPESLRFLCH